VLRGNPGGPASSGTILFLGYCVGGAPGRDEDVHMYIAHCVRLASQYLRVILEQLSHVSTTMSLHPKACLRAF